MKRFWIVLLFSLYLYGYEYNDLLIKTQATIYPKLMMFDQKLSQKIGDERIDFFILYERLDEDVAKKIKRIIQKRYKNRLGPYRFAVHLVNNFALFSDTVKKRKVDALYVLKLEKDAMKKAAAMIKGRSIYSFVYDKDDLSYGFLFAVAIEKDVVIYMNRAMIKRENFDFLTQLYSMVKFVP